MAVVGASKGDEEKNIKKETQTKSLYWIDYTDGEREERVDEKKVLSGFNIYICRRKLLMIIILHLPML